MTSKNKRGSFRQSALDFLSHFRKHFLQIELEGRQKKRAFFLAYTTTAYILQKCPLSDQGRKKNFLPSFFSFLDRRSLQEKKSQRIPFPARNTARHGILRWSVPLSLSSRSLLRRKTMTTERERREKGGRERQASSLPLSSGEKSTAMHSQK